jgi:hypothetical protein
MVEETYQEVVDKIKDDEGEKDDVIEEEKEENESTYLGLETKPVEKVAMIKKQPACRAKLRDKVTCPKCDKELSRHSYDYTHSKFCKGRPHKPPPPSCPPEGQGYDEKEEEEDEDVREITKKLEQMTVTEILEETKPKPKPKPKPPKAQETLAEYTPTDDDIKKYLGNVRKEKAMRKQQGYDKLIRTAF